MSLLPKSIHRCRRYPTKFNSGRDIPSLKPDADKLNKEGEVLFKKIDETVDEASGYITSLKSQS